MSEAFATTIPVAGVRAISKVFAAAKLDQARCNCELLYSQPNSATYNMWLIPLTGKAAKHYKVDASTMKVSRV